MSQKKLRECEPIDNSECIGCKYLMSRVKAIESQRDFFKKKNEDVKTLIKRTVLETIKEVQHAVHASLEGDN